MFRKTENVSNLVYFDTAYLARCYLEDPGYAQVRQLAAQHPVACCALGRVELVAVLHRKLREGSLSELAFNEVLAQFDDDEDVGLWNWLPLDETLLSRAAQRYRRLSKQIYLRTADAIHLTCAHENGFDELYTNDRHMLRASASFGIRAENIIA